jgi:putative exosortase-associated protein (TIGR04073 family)
MKKAMLLLVVMGLLMAPKAFAGESVWEMANSDQYGKKAGGMLGRGVINVATCFMDLIVQTVNGTQDGPPFVGTMTGLGGGLGCTALRVTSGALDVLTFWVPDFNGIPVSRSYDNCLVAEDGAPSAYEAPGVAAQEPASRQPDISEYIKK